MSYTVQDVIDRAVNLSAANQGLANNVPDLITRINTFQRVGFTQFSAVNRYAYQTTATKASTAANGGRVVDLSTLSPPVERTLVVKLPSGVEVSEVDVQDLTAELAPRYYPAGETVVEVGTDWDTATSDAVTLTIIYCSRPADLDPTAGTSQVISVPDGYAAFLWYELGAYFAASDVGRDPGEATSLLAQRDAVLAAWIAHGGHFAGVPAYRLAIPSPSPADKK